MRPAEAAAMARAVALAAWTGATTSPNPAVGAVVLDPAGRRVGEGVTEPPPGRHAEVVALAAAGERARGGTVVVTLEPCAHQGRTPPCTTALALAGIARVVVAHADPNPVAGGGAAALRAAGIDVEQLAADHPLAGAVAGQLEGFLRVVAEGRPHVTLKLAQTSDGRLAASGGRRWVTGPLARAAVHRWRAACDAVLVGSGTVLADDPRLDVRAVHRDRQPRVVVLDARLRTPPHARVVRPGTIVVTRSDRLDTASAARLADGGVTLLSAATGAGGRGLDLRAALRALADAGVCTVLAEPGPTLARALHDARLVDRLVLHVAVHPDDGPPRRVLGPPPHGSWNLERAGGAGPDLILHLSPGAPA